MSLIAGTCQAFAYSGCSGNANRFQTTAACLQACAQPNNGVSLTIQCPAGLTAFTGGGTTQQSCQLGVQTCPQGSVCMPAASGTSALCCIGTPVCPGSVGQSTAQVCTVQSQCTPGWVQRTLSVYVCEVVQNPLRAQRQSAGRECVLCCGRDESGKHTSGHMFQRCRSATAVHTRSGQSMHGWQ